MPKHDPPSGMVVERILALISEDKMIYLDTIYYDIVIVSIINNTPTHITFTISLSKDTSNASCRTHINTIKPLTQTRKNTHKHPIEFLSKQYRGTIQYLVRSMI